MIQIYHNNRCTKSRQALAELESSGKAFEVIYYLETPLNKIQLKGLLSKPGIAPFDLIRKGEKIFIENYKGKILTDPEWIDAMVEHPILIERPIVVSGNKAVIARPTEKINEILV
ncbi:arsenate reductase (glutaredoxin) [Pedobacter petrophilus]|uniref:Arsenate reductase (Glutaredoxin) n=1 Tax=Pedobacter petrophilus TaxID=1908241 RepID=A0A7K0G515_9SPHI|nr:arsenate reductase (glutaredoxin) [Pedobacter petrophilus]MRX78454.1 arsenate reductase (glutaredoxin) [Pedobacter petrophilus]